MLTEPVIDTISLDDFRIDLIEHETGARYGYRGTVIEAVDDGGWDVLQGDRPRGAQYAEIGWGGTLYDALTVANEHVDGFERIKR